MTIFEQLMDGVQKGQSYYINFKTRDLKLNKKFLVKNGKYDGKYGFLPYKAREHIEELFNKYYFSVSCERSDMKSTYFSALESDEMSMEETVCGESRFVAQAELEGYVLGLILSNCPWSEIAYNEKDFVWQSKNNKNLIVWKEWFEENINA